MKLLLCVFIVFCLCFVLIFAKSECEIRHKKALKEKEKWIPMCAESGDFEDMQCLEENAGCFCVKPDGTPITKPNRTLKTCKCLIHRENVASRKMVGSYKPNCEEDGNYKKVQCSGSTGSCWCVDENGKRNNRTLESCSPPEIKI